MMRRRQAKARAIAEREQRVLAGIPAPPDRPDRVDDVAGPEVIAAGNPRLARGTAAEDTAGG